MNETLPKIVQKRKKRLGLGRGSGKGSHTVGRGEKGQKARGKVGILFEGYKVKKSLIKRLPLRRGKGKFLAGKKPLVVDLELLNIFPSGTVVDLDKLIAQGLVDKSDAKIYGVKVLGNGKIEKKINVNLPISKSAARQVEKVGGKVVKN
jgi:large subunit ribosomal protein L15